MLERRHRRRPHLRRVARSRAAEQRAACANRLGQRDRLEQRHPVGRRRLVRFRRPQRLARRRRKPQPHQDPERRRTRRTFRPELFQRLAQRLVHERHRRPGQPLVHARDDELHLGVARRHLEQLGAGGEVFVVPSGHEPAGEALDEVSPRDRLDPGVFGLEQGHRALRRRLDVRLDGPPQQQRHVPVVRVLGPAHQRADDGEPLVRGQPPRRAGERRPYRRRRLRCGQFG